MMLHDAMKKGEYLLRDNKTARKIVRIKKSKEFEGELLYVLEGLYGTELSPQTLNDLERNGFTQCVTIEELNTMFRRGEYVPSEMNATFSR